MCFAICANDQSAFNPVEISTRSAAVNIRRSSPHQQPPPNLISQRTVQNHVASVLKKLQLHNRVELTLYAIDQGLHDPSAP